MKSFIFLLLTTLGLSAQVGLRSAPWIDANMGHREAQPQTDTPTFIAPSNTPPVDVVISNTITPATITWSTNNWSTSDSGSSPLTVTVGGAMTIKAKAQKSGYTISAEASLTITNEPSSLMNGLVSYWKLDETSGGPIRFCRNQQPTPDWHSGLQHWNQQ